MTTLPYSGGFMDQPAKTMEALRIIQGLFIDKLIEESKR